MWIGLSDEAIESMAKGTRKMKKEDIIEKLDKSALFSLCELYDVKEGAYPESVYEGDSVFTFFLELENEGNSGDDPEGLSFSRYVYENSSTASLRECFFNYFIARRGTLPRSDKECRDEIETAIAIYFKEENGFMGPAKIELDPKDFAFSIKVENGQMVDFDITIEHSDKLEERDESVHPLVARVDLKEPGIMSIGKKKNESKRR